MLLAASSTWYTAVLFLIAALGCHALSRTHHVADPAQKAWNFARFVRGRPAEVRTGIILAAALYLTGVIGMEALGAATVSAVGQYSVPYLLASGCEDLLEMVGVIWLIRTLLAA
ncbi:MAG: hypothetical protein ABIR79_22865 [Candidatus Binatia bacterium]